VAVVPPGVATVPAGIRAVPADNILAALQVLRRISDNTANTAGFTGRT